jgi:ATP-dependent DNA helicase HFM1/MER3
MEKKRVDQALPVEVRKVFPFAEFNEMQSCLLSQAFQSNQNMLVGAPSGTGKTTIMEFAICRAFLIYGAKGMKCIYIAPNKALCQQRWLDWSIRFSRIGLNVLELTGDSDIQNYLTEITNSSIIITTPEKWDVITRCWRNHTFLLCGVSLFLIDEIHHLAERERGAVLEAVIVRMMLVANTKSADNKENR